MVELVCSSGNNFNACQWPQLPEQETTDLTVGKRTMKVNDIDQETPFRKRRKSSSLQTPNEQSLDSNESPVPNSQCNPLYETVLGLNLKKSESLLELIQAALSEAQINRSKKVDKARVGIVRPVDNLKASNFPAILLRIGKWEYVSKHEGDLVAKCYFAKHKLVWEVLDGGLKNKIEIEWEAIVGLKANCPHNGPGTLTIVLSKQPQFFREINPQPRKHTVWQATTDFTDGEASSYRQHYLQCAQGVLNKHFEKLINCDTRLNLLSQQGDASWNLSAAKDSVKHPNELRNNGSNQPEMSKGPAVTCIKNAGPLGLVHGYVEDWDLVRSKAIGLVKKARPQRTMSISDFVNHTAHTGRVYENQLVENISQILLNKTHLTTPSDEKSPMSGVSYSDPGGNDHFNPSCDPTPANENGMSRDDSFTNLLNQLPQIESLPRLFIDPSQGLKL